MEIEKKELAPVMFGDMKAMFAAMSLGHTLSPTAPRDTSRPRFGDLEAFFRAKEIEIGKISSRLAEIK